MEITKTCSEFAGIVKSVTGFAEAGLSDHVDADPMELPPIVGVSVKVELFFDNPQNAYDYAMWFSRRMTNDQGRFSVRVKND